MPAQLLVRHKNAIGGTITEVVVWRVPHPVSGCKHHYKYRLFSGLSDGTSLVRYDNERGKGGYRHIRDKEERYLFINLRQLLRDFDADKTAWINGEAYMSRDFKVGIVSEEDFNQELERIFDDADNGKFPETPSERVYFGDMKTFLEYITPKRFALMEALHRSGPMTIYALAKMLQRHYKNVHDDVKALERIGLVEKNDGARYLVPWDEITASTRLAA